MRSRMAAEPRSAPPIPDIQDCPRPLIVDGVKSQGVFTSENRTGASFIPG